MNQVAAPVQHIHTDEPTIRAKWMAGLESDMNNTALRDDVRIESQLMLKEQLLYMEQSKLCPTCGYPLDNSWPHPAAKTWQRGREKCGY